MRAVEDIRFLSPLLVMANKEIDGMFGGVLPMFNLPGFGFGITPIQIADCIVDHQEGFIDGAGEAGPFAE